MNGKIERLALAFSDGSFGVLRPGQPIEDAFEEAKDADRNENDPANFTRVVTISVEEIANHGHPTRSTATKACPACGRPHEISSARLLAETAPDVPADHEGRAGS